MIIRAHYYYCSSKYRLMNARDVIISRSEIVSYCARNAMKTKSSTNQTIRDSKKNFRLKKKKRNNNIFIFNAHYTLSLGWISARRLIPHNHHIIIWLRFFSYSSHLQYTPFKFWLKKFRASNTVHSNYTEFNASNIKSN